MRRVGVISRSSRVDSFSDFPYYPSSLYDHRLSRFKISISMSRVNKRDKLKQLREARKAGTSLLHYNEVDEDDNEIYDELDESQYRQHKRDQLMNDDFIVDDDGEGYVDNGADEWDDSTRPNYYSDEEESSSKKKKHSKDQKPVKKTAQINNFFQPMNRMSSVPKPQNAKKIDVNLDDILDDFDVNKPRAKKQKTNNPFATSFKKLTTKKPSKALDPFSTSRKSKTKKNEDIFEEIDSSMDIDNVDQQPSSPIKAEVKSEAVEEKENIQQAAPKSEEDSDSEDEVVLRRPRASASIKHDNQSVTSSKAASFKEKIPKPELRQPLSSSPARSFAPADNYTEKLDESRIVDNGSESENPNSFKMFWLDYCEVDGSLLLFGKVLTREGKCVSGVVQVNGLYRELFFLPRKYRMTEAGEDLEDKITPMDIHQEVTPLLLQQYGLEKLRAKPEKMKYAFELPGIPKETEYLKVLMPYRTPRNKNLIMPADLKGETFNHIFGTNANLFESFVLQRNIMGPCWLEILSPDFDGLRNATHCQVEVAVDSPSLIKPITNVNIPAPNLTVTSISVQTVMDAKNSKQEVAAISLATYRNIPQDTPIDENTEPTESLTLARPVGGATYFPPGLQQLGQKQGMNLKTLPNEKVLLNGLNAFIKSTDPDVFIGHRLENISLDVLVHRMYDLKVPTWSSLGRRNRKTWPDRFGRSSGGFNNSLQIREIFQGRLLCDIANEMGQSLTPKCQSWDLPEMYDVVCHKKHTALEINYQTPSFSEDASLFLMALNENDFNAKITAEISFSTQILSLSKQLTNLAGNAWSHTLSGTRAGRNEFILLHEFKRNNYIVPDKEDRYHKNSQQQQNKLESSEDDATTVTSNKKPKFQGGLVFEPEKGLHKNYILVMDFNSLYPSIIQEFNICFTTVDRDDFNVSHDEDKDLPIIPDRDSSQGVLPRLLNTLVTRRREVKKLLKDPKNSPVEKAQFDIKQQALKLTANSMYGCLGYVNSRFYAKPLAMLVTNKGREILMDTRQLAESIGLRVVYGDTDSVMIDTGVDNLKEALKIGEEFKVQVNERYRLLEIDTDNVFKRLLLHAKKKYAAMNVSIDKKTGQELTALEVKGLDMRRREYCQLSKDISTFVLQKLLSDTDPEQALGEVYDYLEETTQKIKNNEIPIDRYKVNTRLSKDPSNYPNGKSMPPVQVAFRLRSQGKVIKAGSVITFVITAANDENETKESSPADRARAITEVLAKNSNYKPDANYYLEKQIFAPVERLLERIEGIDMVRVAKCLGIDTKKYILRVKNNESANGEIVPLESNITDIERFRLSSYLIMNCKCGHKFRFGGILASNDYKVTFNGISCGKCDYTFPQIKIASQLENAIRTHLASYYAGWLVCDDGACGITTRQISVYGRRCIGSSGTSHGCKGVMKYKYTDKALYNQLLYFNSIFDVDKAKKNELKPIYDVFDTVENQPKKLASGQVDALAEQNRELFTQCQDVIQKYLGDCGRRYVDMSGLFDWMSKA